MMLKPLLISTLLISASTLSFAELTLSEKVRPQIKSLVNPDIQRLALPPTPNNMSLPAYGQGIIG